MLHRSLLPLIRATLDDSRVVLLQGARQSGKTTLAQVIRQERNGLYEALDLATTRAAIDADPAGFLSSAGDRLLVLDEVQRMPELFLPLKVIVDQNQRRGRFLLTGSASILSLPRLADSLAGRMRLLTLWPLSQGEILGRRERFVDRVFGPETDPAAERTSLEPHLDSGPPPDLVAAAMQGGFPERIGRTDPLLNRTWYQSYLTTIVERDAREIVDVHSPGDLLRILSVIATRTGSLLNYSDLSRGVGLVDTTLKRHIALLEKVFLVRRLPPWTNRFCLKNSLASSDVTARRLRRSASAASKPPASTSLPPSRDVALWPTRGFETEPSLDERVTKSSKLYLTDSGLLTHLLSIDQDRLRHDPTLAGPLMETFVHMELVKQIGWSATQPTLHHFRTPARREVDFVLERPGGEIVGIEVKSSSEFSRGDFLGLHALREVAGERFLRGVVLYRGAATVPLGPGMWAVPIPSLFAPEPADGEQHEGR